jgi:endonuclease YncB( thermonuclease family)
MSKHWNPRKSGRVRLTLLVSVCVGLGLTSVVGLQAGPSMAAASVERVSDPSAVIITDGDTFRYRGAKIRIADIDTPEVRGRCETETRLAARATHRMQTLLRAGPFEMRPIPGRDEDRYGRKLRVVVRNGRSLGDQLVAEGLARTWEGRRRPWCESDAD